MMCAKNMMKQRQWHNEQKWQYLNYQWTPWLNTKNATSKWIKNAMNIKNTMSKWTLWMWQTLRMWWTSRIWQAPRMQWTPKTWQACKHQKHDKQMSTTNLTSTKNIMSTMNKTNKRSRNVTNTMIMKNNQTPKLWRALKPWGEHEH
jgi:hypothetical protein